ncbi:hypothetical protein P4O66_011006, partial [Electrophorus voltai]
ETTNLTMNLDRKSNKFFMETMRTGQIHSQQWSVPMTPPQKELPEQGCFFLFHLARGHPSSRGCIMSSFLPGVGISAEKACLLERPLSAGTDEPFCFYHSPPREAPFLKVHLRRLLFAFAADTSQSETPYVGNGVADYRKGRETPIGSVKREWGSRLNMPRRVVQCVVSYACLNAKAP